MNPRDLATVLAALRVYEQAPNHLWRDVEVVATDGGRIEAMKREEIDALCQRLNVTAEPPDVVVTLDGGLVQKSEEMAAPLAAIVAWSAR